jgi:hypothetical protein
MFVGKFGLVYCYSIDGEMLTLLYLHCIVDKSIFVVYVMLTAMVLMVELSRELEYLW